MDAAGGGCRATLRALDPAPRCGTVGRGRARRRGAGRRADPSDRARSTLLAELAAAPTGELPAADLAARHGPTAAAGLVRRGLAEAEVRERPRRPLAARPAGRRGGRPAASDLLPAQAEAVDRIVAAIAARDPRPLLLDGVTGGGKTAIYVEAIAASLEAGRPALVLVPEIALALPLVDRLRADLDARVALVHSGLGEGERSDEWRRIRAGDVDIVVGTRLAVVAPLADVGRDHRRRGARRGLQERPDAAAPGSRRGDPAGRSGRRGDRARVGDARRRERRPGADRRLRPRGPAGAPGRRRTDGRGRRPARRTGGRPARPAVALAVGAPSPGSTRPAASRRSSSSTGAARPRSCCAATAATSRPARTASDRSSTTRPGRRCAATTAAGRPRSRRAARRAARRASATWAAARNASSARSATPSRACASAGSIATSSSTAARRSASSMPSPRAGSTSSSGRAS